MGQTDGFPGRGEAFTTSASVRVYPYGTIFTGPVDLTSEIQWEMAAATNPGQITYRIDSYVAESGNFWLPHDFDTTTWMSTGDMYTHRGNYKPYQSGEYEMRGRALSCLFRNGAPCFIAANTPGRQLFEVLSPFHPGTRGDRHDEGAAKVTPSTIDDKRVLMNRWDGLYQLKGDVETSSPTNFTLARTLDVRYHPERKTLMWFGELHPESDPETPYGIGMILNVDSEKARAINRVNLITPNPRGGTTTFGFIAKRPIPWLALKPGQLRSSMTRDAKYVLSVARTASAMWDITIEPSRKGPPDPWLTRGKIHLEASAPKPPWDRMELSFAIESDAGDARGHFMLRRAKDLLTGGAE